MTIRSVANARKGAIRNSRRLRNKTLRNRRLCSKNYNEKLNEIHEENKKPHRVSIYDAYRR